MDERGTRAKGNEGRRRSEMEEEDEMKWRGGREMRKRAGRLGTLKVRK